MTVHFTFLSCKVHHGWLDDIWEYHRQHDLQETGLLSIQSDTAVVKTRRDSRDGSVSISSQTSALLSPPSGHSEQGMHLRRFDKIFLFPWTLIHKIFSYCFILVTKYFADSLIFAETCTADCPQFLEDRQKLGELRLVVVKFK